MRDEKEIVRLLLKNGMSTKRANHLAKQMVTADPKTEKKDIIEVKKALPTVVKTVDRVEVIKEEVNELL